MSTKKPEKVGRITTEVYALDDGFCIEFPIAGSYPTNWEAWMYHKDIGVKMFMFGISSDTMPYSQFTELAVDEFDTHRAFYEEQYMS